MKSTEHKWLLWANLLTVLPAVTIMLLAGLFMGDQAGYIALYPPLIPLFVAMDVVLIIDLIVGIRFVYRKISGKA